jgi:hypothetical protein
VTMSWARYEEPGSSPAVATKYIFIFLQRNKV